MRPADLDALVALCAEHAEYEQARFENTGQRERLTDAFFGPLPRLLGWTVGEPTSLLGYATATVDFSTWSAMRYLHMDCLYVRADARGRGLGQLLLGAVRDAAAVRGIREVQWQTPQWNTDAQRFYQRFGAGALPKQRYTLLV